ncbi:MAG: helix-turn-helix transcriptional regulator [Thermoflexales bacterium]|nr:helix-turn-helix transcriptional regulator [Thermoflexales bacterium]
MKTRFANWIENQYLDWQKKQGGRKTVTEFAAWLGFAKSTVSQWLNGRGQPNTESLHRLAQKLGLDVYTVLELPSPDPLLFSIQASWDILSDSEREAMGKIVQEAKGKAAK